MFPRINGSIHVHIDVHWKFNINIFHHDREGDVSMVGGTVLLIEASNMSQIKARTWQKLSTDDPFVKEDGKLQ